MWRVLLIHPIPGVLLQPTAVAVNVAVSPSPAHTPMAAATRSQERFSTLSSLLRYVVVTANDEWSRNALAVPGDFADKGRVRGR